MCSQNDGNVISEFLISKISPNPRLFPVSCHTSIDREICLFRHALKTAFIIKAI